MVDLNEAATVVAVAGLGIASMPSWACENELESGRLVEVLPDWEMGLIELHALYPVGRSAKPSARTFVDYLVDEFKD
jgi:DNA-binding transcriptional LysR family regulator